MKKIIYLDNAATTSIDKTIAKSIEKLSTQNYANPSSQHSLGKDIKNKIEKARKELAKTINANPEEIIFTSGGTESDNMAIKGIALANKGKNHIITSEIEHPAILETCKHLQEQGFEITHIKPNSDGIINPKHIEKAITKQTLLVSIMHVNNEIGSIQPIKEIGKICKKNKIYFHSDCVQSFTKIPINIKELNLDLISISGHKIHAPKGIGFLYIKKEIQQKIQPIINGGGHENNLRSGTENTTGIIALSKAIKLKTKKNQIKKIRDKLIKQILKIPGARLNGPGLKSNKRIYNNINLSFYGIEGESLMLMLDKQGIIVSTGSACSSHKLSESHVLKSIKIPPLYINGSIRITLDPSKPLTNKEISYIIKSITENIEKLRKISPFKLDQINQSNSTK